MASFNGADGVCLNCHGSGGFYDDDTFIHDIVISSNTILSNAGNGIYLCSWSSGYYSGAYIYNLIVSSNIVSSNMENGIYSLADHRFAEIHFPGTVFSSIFSNNTVLANSWCGICLEGYNASFSSNLISYNLYGIFLASAQNNQAHYNDICSNVYGMNVTSGATVTAEHDYWGDSSGPFHASLNPEGKGNPVNGNGVDLDFIPFLTSPHGYINQRPVAALSVDKITPNINETVTFDATNSTDDGRIDYYFFDFGDGTNSSWTTLPVVTHKYSQQNTYNVTLIVMDDFGVTSINTQQTTVQVIVISEFPTMLILPIFIIVTALAVMLCKKTREKLGEATFAF
jgi:PKD repeat protein